MNTDDIVNKFANTLQNHNVRPSILYGDKRSDSPIDKEVKVRDVLTIISKQLKAIKNADSGRRDVRQKKYICLNEKSVSVNLTPVKIQSNTENKFETQCTLDTQLINFIENAEAMSDVRNSKKESDKPFCCETVNNDCKQNNVVVIRNSNHNTENKSTTNVKNINVEICQNVTSSEENKLNNVINSCCDKNKSCEAEDGHTNKTLNDYINNNDAESSIANNKEEPSSPILRIVKPIFKSQPLIYTLEEFDKFESLAGPVVNEITDFEDAKRMINSQLKDINLFVKTHSEIVTTDKETECNIKNLRKSINRYPKTQYSFDINSGIIEDEILFDSDDDIKYSDELPLTCALETSFYNNTEVLDKTMFVGFQTASNRSIQILSDSFIKAKTVFDNISKNIADNLTMTELVEAIDKKISYEDDNFRKESNKIDNVIANKNRSITPEVYNPEDNKIEHKNIIKNSNNHITEHIDEHILREFEKYSMPYESNKTIDITNQIKTASIHASKEIDNNLQSQIKSNITGKINVDKNNLKSSISPNFIGFKTANNKRIKISDQAILKTKSIFDDIDINNSQIHFIINPAQSLKENNYDFVGFKTANNKKITISPEAMLKTKTIFDNINTEMLNYCQKDTSKQPKKQKSIETETVINAFINSMSLKNMESSEIKETNLEKDVISNNKNINNFNVVNHKGSNQFRGFKTASNRTVLISDNVLQNSKKNFQDIEKDDVQNKGKFKEIDNELYLADNKSFKGFITANNKPIKISDEALVKSKKLFQNIEDENIFSNDFIQPSILQGFITPKKSQSKILFQDIKDEDYKIKIVLNDNVQSGPNVKSICVTKEITGISDKLIKKSCFAGFQTASNKNVKISEEALIKSKKVFEDIDLHNKIKEKEAYEIATNCSNKKVYISEEALVKNEKVFKNICDKNQFSEEELIKNIREKLKNNADRNIDVIMKTDIHKPKEIIINEENKLTENGIHVEDYFNTEMIKIFDESLDTEDFFKDTTSKCKRSGSPILSCSKSKRKKFIVPKIGNNILHHDIEIPKSLNLFKFDRDYKKIKEYKLTDILPKRSINSIENIDPYILNFNFDTLLDFRFENNRNDIDSDSWTTEKIKKYFTDCVNKKLIPAGWIDNHIKLIIWKLISYEMFSPDHMKYVCSIKNVLQQLKYRYDRELYNVERPALRKILEKDDVSTKFMILCVANFYVGGVSVSSVSNGAKNIELLLTDGWYCVKASADSMIDNLIIDRKISIGSKLAIHGAELLNCEQGISPWEDKNAIRLKISGNSTKRAKWDARLGFHGKSSMLSPLTAVRLDGGKISKLRVFVTRVYPTMYIEKFEDGSTVTRSERLEHLHQMRWETERQIQMEKLYEEIVKISEQESNDSEELYTEQENLETGSQILRLMEKSKDPLDFKSKLTPSQAHKLNDYTEKQNEKLIQKIQNKAQLLIKKRGLDVSRNVVPLMKVRVFDERKATITIWRPDESLLDFIKEGAWIDVYNVMPTSIRYSEIQISAGRQSIFCKSKIKETETLRIQTRALRRKCHTIKDLQSSMTTDYNEIDTLGFVFLIEPKDYDGTRELFQNVYLSGVDKSIVSVNFWGGIKKFGFENILEVGQIVACVNLQKRAGNTRYIPQFRATEYTYFTKTPKFDSAKKLLDELSTKFVKMDKNKFIQDCMNLKNNYSNFKYSNTENISPYRMNNSEYNISRNKMFIESPLINNDSKPTTALDFKSNLKQTGELSPYMLLRKNKVKEKISKLKIYGEPPPLNHIHIINKSSNAIRPYKSPLISNDISPSSPKINLKNIHLTSRTLTVNEKSSIVLNRTSAKINPVKLNFALDENNCLQELDSQPLSLDVIK